MIIDKSKKEMGILGVYILNSVGRRPQSGYDILADIKRKTGSEWVPSKGTIYPLIQNMEKEGDLKVSKVGKRSKKTYQLTKAGKRFVKDIPLHHSKIKEKYQKFRSLLSDVFGESAATYGEHVLEIKEIAFSMDSSKKSEVIKVLKECARKLKEIP